MSCANQSELLATVRSLPPLPAGVRRLLGLDQGSENFLEDATSILRTDPALVAQLIKIANSALYASQDETETLEQALIRVGVRTSVGALVSSHLMRTFHPAEPSISNLWLTSLFAAIMSRNLAASNQELGLVPELAWTSGLLHDVGRLVLVELAGESRGGEHRDLDDHSMESLAEERELFGFDHEFAGRLLANAWKFPRSLTLIIACHHSPIHPRARASEELLRMISLVNLTDSVGDVVRLEDSDRDAMDIRLSTSLGEDPAAACMDHLQLSRRAVLEAARSSLEEHTDHATSMRIRPWVNSRKLGV